jgi:hypothetical protein
MLLVDNQMDKLHNLQGNHEEGVVALQDSQEEQSYIQGRREHIRQVCFLKYPLVLKQ